jgi:hypothetical protein
MKKIFFLIVLAAPLLLQAQMHFSTNVRQDYIWSSREGDWILVAERKEEVTFVDFNKELTVMKHTTPGMTSSYMINNIREVRRNERFELEIVSDAGNRYYMFIDIPNKKLQFINRDYTTLVQHTIRKTWFDD